jgi:hypothetical protein
MHNFQYSIAKAFGQELGESKNLLLKNGVSFVGSGTNDFEVGLAEFHHYLTANTAWSAEIRAFAVGRSTCDGDNTEIFAVLAQSLCEGYAFSAHGGRESGILDVASLEHPAVGAEQGSTDHEAGIRRIGMLPCFQSVFYQS